MDDAHTLDARYTRRRVLANGGSSVVYEAWDRIRDQEVAVKVLSKATSDAARRELAALQALRLPGVVRLLDDGVDADGRTFLVTDLVRGTPYPGGAVTWPALRPILIETLRVLRSVHATGIVHRDLKPEHVLIGSDGRPTLLDLGLARGEAVDAKDEPEVAGNLRYAAPEQLVGNGPDPRSDLYALGLLTFEALTGRLPHEHALPGELRRLRLAGEITVPESVPEEARVLLERLLDRRPKRRPQTAEGALELVGAAAASECEAAFAHWTRAPDRTALMGLFRGPERLLHLRSDAADLLWHRCGPDAYELSRELSAWVRHGLARWEDGAIRIARTDIDRLRIGLQLRTPATDPGASPLPDPLESILAAIHLGWPDTGVPALAALTDLSDAEVEKHCAALQHQGWVRPVDERFQVRRLPISLLAWDVPERARIHIAIAEGLSADEPRLLFHLQAAGQWRGVAQVAVRQGLAATDRGDLTSARTILESGLRAARWLGDEAIERSLLEALVRTTLAEDSVRGFELMLYALCRSASPPSALEMLTRAGRAARDGALEEAEQLLSRLPSFDAEETDRWRWALRVRVALRNGAGDTVLSGARSWALERSTETARADVLNWEGLFAYHRGAAAEAAHLHALAAEGKRHGTGRLAARANQLAALLEVPDLDAATQAAPRLRDEAAAVGSSLYEAYAEWVLRVARYRSGVATRPDWELVDAARHLEVGVLPGQLLFQEAVHAWRAGDLPSAHRLAAEAAPYWAGDGRRALKALPRAVELACGSTFDRAAAGDLARFAVAPDRTLPGLWLQALGILAWRSQAFRGDWRTTMLELADSLPPSMKIGRREILSVEEAVDGVHIVSAAAMEE
ncbi:MAG: serine/threonine-protein kinase [Myxococcota bacterium]